MKKLSATSMCMGPPPLHLDHDRRRASLKEPPERDARGQRSGVSDDDVARARYDYWWLGVSQSVLAARLKRSPGWVSQVVRFLILRHVV